MQKKKFKWKRFFKRASAVAAAVIVTFIIFDLAVAFYMYSDMGAIPTDGAKYPTAHIKNVVWPTIGYPAITRSGESLDIEVDLRDASSAKKSPRPAQPTDATGWSVTFVPVEKTLKGIVLGATVEKAWAGPSAKWPKGSREGLSDSVWHVTCRMPAGAPADLYDLKLDVDTGGGHVTDTQPNSVSITRNAPGDFRYITLADIHVHARDVGGLFEKITNKGIDPKGKPLFLEAAIDQVNLISPDFVVLIGDFVYAQRTPGEYQKEFANFFAELSRFEVPVFAVPGNHDQYVNQVDGAKVWEQNIGPLYYSFDMAGAHFACLNTYEWSPSVRTVCRKFGALFVYPRTGRGKVQLSKNDSDISTYKQQLEWLANDLKEHQGSNPRIVFCHHDPYRASGKGSAYTQKFQGIWPLPGDNGKVSILKLCAKYRVNMLMSGHMHNDYVGKASWSDKKGQTIFANQTCVYFDKGGYQNQYPGYRLVTVNGGKIQGYSYVNEFHSIPLYDGSNLKGKTDLDNIITPAISGEEAPELEQPDEPGLALLKSYLAVPVKVQGLMAVVPSPKSGGYQVLNGKVFQTVTLPDGNEAIYVEATIPAGKPGTSASEPGKPARLWVGV
jgi:3',5'-cyclic AMP phosphodiesterase CpdA